MMRATGKAVMGTRAAGSGSVFGRPKLRATDKEFEENRRAKVELEAAIESMAGNGLTPRKSRY
jgi:hypothetical protein